jgi:hypothetical protein
MWCQKCQADVAGIASPDNQRALCTTCGTEIARSAQGPPVPVQPLQAKSELSQSEQAQSEQARPTPPQIDQTVVDQGAKAPAESTRSLRDPRELLARWAREDALNPLELAVAREPVSENRKALNRIDSSHSIAAPRVAAFIEHAHIGTPLPPAPSIEKLSQTSDHHNMFHPAHAPGPPHFQTAPVSMADKSSKWVSLVGQIFAYVGVGGLTVGTSLVLMGYFGGPASYITTGWLVATAGQMLLFLGVVTLVSGGMEQTTQEVARRIDTIGERLVRIEQAAERSESKRAA